MRVIIAGSRWINGMTDLIEAAIRASGFCVMEIVSGGARGPDTSAILYARKNSLPFKIFPAGWKLNGNSAGPIRNREMADYADALIAIWDGISRGTSNMIQEMQKRGKPVFVLMHPKVERQIG